MDHSTNNNMIPYQFDHCPRWLEYSGLPKLLGGSAWQVFKKLIELESRFCRKNLGEVFHYSHIELGKTLGRSRSFVGKNLLKLEEKGFIKYCPGYYKGTESMYKIIYPISTPSPIYKVEWKYGGLKYVLRNYIFPKETLDYLLNYTGLDIEELQSVLPEYTFNGLVNNQRNNEADIHSLSNESVPSDELSVLRETESVFYDTKSVLNKTERVSGEYNSNTNNTNKTNNKEDNKHSNNATIDAERNIENVSNIKKMLKGNSGKGG